MPKLFGFPAELARPLVKVARRERNARVQGVLSSRQFQDKGRKPTYLIESSGTIPAATLAGGFTLGKGSGYILELDTDSTSGTYLQLARAKATDGSDHPTVDVYNLSTMGMTGSTSSPLLCVSDVRGALYVVSASGGMSYIAMAETKTEISAGSITSGVLTPGSGLVYPMYRDAADSNKLKRMKDESMNDIEITVYSTALQKITKHSGRFLQINQGVNGTYWVVPPDYGPVVALENVSAAVSAATYTGGGSDTLEPTAGAFYILTIDPTSGEYVRLRDASDTSDIQITAYNPNLYEIDVTKGNPVFAGRDPDGHYVIASLPIQTGIAFFDTYSGGMSAGSGTTPSQTTCRILSFNGTSFSDSGNTETIFNTGPATKSNTMPRIAAYDMDGNLFRLYMPDGNDCEELAGKEAADFNVIDDASNTQYLLGVDDDDCYVRIPVTSCT